MKIGNSTIQFNVTANDLFDYERNFGYIAKWSGQIYANRRDAIKDIPYWRLYARKGDIVGEGWTSTRNLTYDEIVEYLTNYKRHRVLEAYPRLSKPQRRVYCVKHDEFEPCVFDKYTGEIYMVVDTTRNNEITYIHPELRHRKAFLYNKLFPNSERNCRNFLRKMSKRINELQK